MLIPRMIQHVVGTLNRHRMGRERDGRTPYARVKSRRFSQVVADFGMHLVLEAKFRRQVQRIRQVGGGDLVGYSGQDRRDIGGDAIWYCESEIHQEKRK